MAELLSSIVNKIKHYHVEELIDEKFIIPVPTIEDFNKLNKKLITYADIEWIEPSDLNSMYRRYGTNACVILETNSFEEFQLAYGTYDGCFKHCDYELISIDSILEEV